MQEKFRKAVFFERDGVINEYHGAMAPTTLTKFRIYTGIKPLISKLKEFGFLVIITTNQPGLSNTSLCRRNLDTMHSLIRSSLPIDDIMVCPHASEDDCPCLKPKAGLFMEAANKWHINLWQSFVISDKWQDDTAAKNIQATSYQIKSPYNGKVSATSLVNDVAEAVKKIERLTIVQHSHFVLARNQSYSNR